MKNYFHNATTCIKGQVEKKRSIFIVRLIIFFGSFGLFSPVFSQITAFNTDFENATSTFSANGWTVVNPWTNKWIVGSVIPYQGAKGAFVSANDGYSNGYNDTIWQNAHFYRDVTLPVGVNTINLSFAYRGIGEAGFDRILVYTAPTSVTPTVSQPAKYGSTITNATLRWSQTVLGSAFSIATISLPASLAGTTFRLIITWQNDDNTGTWPAAAIDNISMTYQCTAASLSAATTQTCVGGSTGTITATATGGTPPYTYCLNAGTYTSSNIFTGLAAGIYTLNVKTNLGCVTSTSVTVSPFAASPDNQNAAATNSWIGHVYTGTNFTSYIGNYTEAENFNQSFGGATNCFNVTSNATTRSIYTQNFSVKYRMNSTRKGLYVADLGSDDGSRLTVDGTMIYNNWSDQAFVIRPSVLFKLSGNSSLLYEFYENGGGNQAAFQNLSLILANTLSTNLTQNFCTGATGMAISGDTYSTLPSGISLPGTGYQWAYSTTPGGTKINIIGATGATYVPGGNDAPFNVPGTYYLYRIANVTSTNNINPNPYTASLESNAAGVNVTGVNISQIPTANIIANYKFEGNADDFANNNAGTLQGSPTQTTDRFGITNAAFNFNGSSQYVSTANSYNNPTNFTISIWFKTATTNGGKLIGFGSSQTGSSGSYDRHIYMNNAGQIYFGVYPNTVVTVNSALSYNDDKWHQATATLSGAGMILYIDGAQVGSNASTTTSQNYTGYWRIGYDNVGGWTSQPSSNYFNGNLDDAIIYHRDLSAAEVATIYNSPDGAGNSGPVCSGSAISLSATTVGGATYSWSGPNGFTSSAQNPSFTFTAANAGMYTLQITSGGCTSTAYTNVVSTNNDGQWTGNISTDWADANNWCSGVVPSSTTNVTITSSAVRMPVISSNAFCNSLTLNSGATVTTNVGGTLNVAGNIANAGAMTNNGTTNFNGTGAQQTFTGITNFNNLTLNNTNGLILPVAIIVSGNLILTSGILTANNFPVSLAGNWINNATTNAFAGGTSAVVFNGTANQSISGSVATTFNNVTVNNNGFVLSLAVNANIAGNLTVTKGTFDLGAFTANRTAAGGILTVDNNAILKIGGTNTYPTNYATSTLSLSSTVEYSGTNQTVSNQTYGNLKFSSSTGAAVKTLPNTAMAVMGNLTSIKGVGTSVTYSALASITINGNDTIGVATTFNSGSFNHNIGGNWNNSGIFNGNSGKITFTGNGTLVSGSGAQNFNDLTVAASGVSFSNNNITLSGNLATTGSGNFSQASGGTLTMTGTSKTISGTSISLNNLTISGTVSTANSFDLTGNLNVTGTFTSTPGTISMSGAAKTITGAGNIYFNIFSATGTITATTNFSIASGLVVGGSLTASAGTATFTGNSVLSGTANLFDVNVNGTSLQLSTNSNLGVANTLVITSGILNTASSFPNTVNFNGVGAQNINAITYDNLNLSNGGNKTAISAITVNRNLTIGAGATFVAGAYTHSIYLNWVNNGSFTAGAGTVQFLGNQTSNVTGATTFNILTVNTSTSSAGVVLQSNVGAAIVNMTQGKMLTGSNKITITDTRNGNGIILGNIQRTHAFTTGVDYAFEGPNNTINFSSATSVTSVTVSVVVGHISDFPFGGSISRVYNISVPVGTYIATLRLHYEDNELNGSNESSMAMWNNHGSVWAPIGRTSGDPIANYVEQSGLTNITNRWTLSDNSNVVQWNGSVSSDWNTAANWTVTQGSGSRPPAPTDIVNLGTATFNYNPTISNAVTVKNIDFGSAQAVTLTMTGGGSLVVGDIDGNWSSNITHTINAANQAVTINGDLSLSDGTTGHSINLNIGTGSVAVGGDLNQSGNASIVFSGAGNLSIGADYNYVNGIFTAGAGTVTYNGLVNQVAGSVPYYHLKVNKTSALASINNTMNINGNLDVIAGELDNFDTTTIVGDVTIYAGATLSNSSVLRVGGNWLNNGTYNAQAGNTNVIFNGSGPQTISATTFTNLEFNKTVGSVATLTGDVTMKGNLVGTSGTLDIKNFFFNRDVAGGSATMADNATLIIAADNAPNRFSNYFLANGSTVIFNGTADQHLMLPGVVYGNIIFRNSGTKILYTPITVKSNLTIENTAIFDGGANVITLQGNWINNGTFTPSTSTVLANGITKTISGVTTFNKVTIAGSYTFLNDAIFNGLLNVTSTGSLNVGSGINTILNGDLTSSGKLYSMGSTTLTGNVAQTFSLIDAVSTFALIVNFNGSVPPVFNSTSAPQFAYLNINNTGGVNPSVGWTVNLGFTVGVGASFNGGVSTHNFLGNVTNNGSISGSGTYNFLPASAATINLGTGFINTGRVNFGGAGAITMLGTPISFNNLNINNINTAGLTPSSNWIINNNFEVATGSVLHAANYNYYVGGNIVNSGTINSQTSTFILNGTGTQDINSLSAFNNFTLNKTGGYATLANNLTIGGVLNFTKGIIQTGAYTLVQPTGATVTGAAQNTGWVSGKFQKAIAAATTTKAFEIGDDSVYTPVSLLFASVSTGGNLTASSFAGDHPNLASSSINPSKSLNRYWTITNNGVVFTTATGTFNFVAADVDASAATVNFKAGIYNGSSWILPSTMAPNTTNIQAANFTSFGDFTFGEICNYGTAISYLTTPYCTTAGTASVTQTGTIGGVYSADSGLSIDAITGAVNLGASTPGTYNVAYRIDGTTDCGEYVTYASITVAYPGTWTGAIDSTWNNISNWSCNGIPDATTDVFLPSGLSTYPVITDTKAVHDINIAAGASLIVSGGTFKIAGVINNVGAIDASAGTIEMNGTSAQTMPANSFYNNSIKNLVINNSSVAGVSLDGALDIYGSLTYSGTGKVLYTNDTLTLKSDSAATAWVGDMTGNIITGKVTVERFISKHKAWRLLSIPTNTDQTIKQAWQESSDSSSVDSIPGYGTQIMSNLANWKSKGFDLKSASPSLKTYVDSTDSWAGVPSTDSTNIKNNNGYLLYVRGDRLATGTASPVTSTTLRTKGSLYSGTLAPLTAKPDTYMSVGNPYASAIDFTQLTIGNGIDNEFYAFDPFISGYYGYGGFQVLSAVNGWKPIPGGSPVYPTDSVNTTIQSGAAFFVHATTVPSLLPANYNVVFSENAKVGGGDTLISFARPELGEGFKDAIQSFGVTLFTGPNPSDLVADGNVAVFNNNYAAAIDRYDAKKIAASGENFDLKRNGALLAIEARPSLTVADTLFYNMRKLAKKTYQLRFVAENLEQSGLTPVLIDQYLNSRTTLSLNGRSVVNITVNSDAKSSAANRFMVVFAPQNVLPVTFVNIQAARKDSGILVTWNIENEKNVSHYEIERSSDGTNFSKVGNVVSKNISQYAWLDIKVQSENYYYRIRSVDIDGKTSLSRVVKVLIGKLNPEISVYPNPIVDGVINLQFKNLAAGVYNVRILNPLGQSILARRIDYRAGANVSEVFKLGQNAAAGIYIVEVVSPANEKVSIKVFN